MSKYFHIGLVLLYVLITALASIVLLELFGVHITDAVGLTAVAGWVLICFAAALFSTSFTLFLYLNSRKPTLAEEERLQRCLREILQKAGHEKEFHLLIDEKMEINAFAIGTRTIAVSRGAMEQLNDGELKGLLAHEFGHIRSHDSIVGAAFVMSAQLPRLVMALFKLTRRILVRLFGWRARSANIFSAINYIRRNLFVILLGVAGLIILVNLRGSNRVLTALGGVCAFVLLFSILDYLFGLFRRTISRFIEYERDAYAHALGYGAELREVLHKITREAPQQVNRYSILMNSTHPVIYNRIRRLEKLEGLR